jgi:hypothetical protein
MTAAADMPQMARGYAEMNLAIFPCHWPVFDGGTVRCSCSKGTRCPNIGKHPMTQHGVNDASRDAGKVVHWWNVKPLANIGLAAGPANNFLVLDVDPRHDGDKSLAALEAQHGKLPGTLTALTGSGGHHFFFEHVDGLENLPGKIASGLDIKTKGGYVVAAPSLHKSGRRYEWLHDRPQVAAPQWLIDRINTAGAGGPASSGNGTRSPPDYWSRIANGVAEGERNDALTRLAGKLLGNRHFEPRLALTLLRNFNTCSCHPPLPEDEVDTLFKSIVTRQARKEGFGR